jgi:hypothetical protein
VNIAETLINAMEAKDVYLRGHSARVAEIAASHSFSCSTSPSVAGPDPGPATVGCVGYRAAMAPSRWSSHARSWRRPRPSRSR